MSKAMIDLVKNPAHYTRWAIEPIVFITRNGLEFWRGNIVKYAMRAGFKLYEGKDAVESEIVDLEKVIQYANIRIMDLKEKEEIAMSEADYMDDCQRVDEWDDRHKESATHEVVDHLNETAFRGSRADCWFYKNLFGGYVRELDV